MHISTLNVRGLTYKLKRQYLFKYLRKYSIACLQECYITENTSKIWENDWDGDFIFENGSSHSKGLIILINKNFKIDSLETIRINDRCIGVTFKYLNQLFYIFNVYCPADRNERIPFFDNLTTHLKLDQLPRDSLIITCGDFNAVRNNKLDIISGNPHSEYEVKKFNLFCENNRLIDCWRTLNPQRKDFSWIRYIDKSTSQNNSNLSNVSNCIARRLDYMLCNPSLITFLKSSNMTLVCSTDHKDVSASFQIDHFPKGPGYWHFNDTLLEDENFIKHIRNFITNFYRNTINCNGKREFSLKCYCKVPELETLLV